jgi:hypothetical protein
MMPPVAITPVIMSYLTWAIAVAHQPDKPLVWLHGEIKPRRSAKPDV